MDSTTETDLTDEEPIQDDQYDRIEGDSQDDLNELVLQVTQIVGTPGARYIDVKSVTVSQRTGCCTAATKNGGEGL